MKKKYECLSFPLCFENQQEAEPGEMFERDFEATSGESHEKWLIQLGHMRLVVPTAEVTKTPTGPTPKVAKAKEE